MEIDDVEKFAALPAEPPDWWVNRTASFLINHPNARSVVTNRNRAMVQTLYRQLHELAVHLADLKASEAQMKEGGNV